MTDKDVKELTRAIQNLTTAVLYLADPKEKPPNDLDITTSIVIEPPEGFKQPSINDLKKALNLSVRSHGKDTVFTVLKQHTTGATHNPADVPEDCYQELLEALHGLS